MADFIYYITSFATVLGLPALLVALVVFLVNPKLLNKHPRINNPVSRKKITAVGLASIFVAFMTFGSVLAATEPASVKQARAAEETAATKAEQDKQQQAKKAAEQEAKRKEAEANKPVVKTQTATEPVPFESTEQNDSTLPLGQKKLVVQGVNGERTITIETTYVKDIETARKEIKNEVTKQPVTQVTKVGTYVAPAPPATTSGDGYTNSQGNHVASPSSDPTGASAQCNDGTYSYSQTRRGTCSHHDGVARWL